MGIDLSITEELLAFSREEVGAVVVERLGVLASHEEGSRPEKPSYLVGLLTGQ